MYNKRIYIYICFEQCKVGLAVFMLLQINEVTDIVKVKFKAQTKRQQTRELNQNSHLPFDSSIGDEIFKLKLFNFLKISYKFY